MKGSCLVPRDVRRAGLKWWKAQIPQAERAKPTSIAETRLVWLSCPASRS